MMNGRPLSKKKTVQILVALTLLAWATQTLLSQWGFGQDVPDAASLAEPLSAEKFVPGTPRFAAGATLELRAEATVIGAEVTLKQVARWSKSDDSIFAPLADLVIARLAPRAPFRGIGVEELKGTLHDAGVNLAVIKFAGATTCTIARSDVEYDETVALQQWIDARQSAAAAEGEPADQASEPGDASAHGGEATVASATAVAAPVADSQSDAQAKPYKTLRDILTADLALRTGIPIENLQINFLARGERLLNLSEPHFRFTVEPRRAKTLGDVSWDIEISSDGSSQKATIDAYVRAWQQQLVVLKPLAYKQLIQDADVVERRTLVEDVGDDPLLTREQVVGQQASRDLKPGTILTAPLVDAVPLVRTGQLVTVLLRQGSVEIKSVARATESGVFGQTIRVKNEMTKDVFEVVVAGPQTARLGSDGAGADAGDGATSAQNVASIEGN